MIHIWEMIQRMGNDLAKFHLPPPPPIKTEQVVPLAAPTQAPALFK
jgi:hypothetical protein